MVSFYLSRSWVTTGEHLPLHSKSGVSASDGGEGGGCGPSASTLKLYEIGGFETLVCEIRTWGKLTFWLRAANPLIHKWPTTCEESERTRTECQTSDSHVHISGHSDTDACQVVSWDSQRLDFKEKSSAGRTLFIYLAEACLCAILVVRKQTRSVS